MYFVTVVDAQTGFHLHRWQGGGMQVYMYICLAVSSSYDKFRNNCRNGKIQVHGNQVKDQT